MKQIICNIQLFSLFQNIKVIDGEKENNVKCLTEELPHTLANLADTEENQIYLIRDGLDEKHLKPIAEKIKNITKYTNSKVEVKIV